MKSYLEQAFGRGDVTSARMQAAIREWLNLYYGTQSPGEDAADRLAVLVVSKLCRTVFAEYESRTAEALAPSLQSNVLLIAVVVVYGIVARLGKAGMFHLLLCPQVAVAVVALHLMRRRGRTQ